MKKMTYRQKEQTTDVFFKVINIIILAVVLILLYLPIFIIALQSFNDSKSIFQFNGFTFRWYGALFNKNSPDYARALVPIIGQTLTVTFISTIIATVLGTLFAIGINSLSTKMRQKLILLNNVPILNADVVTGISLMLIFSIVSIVIPNIFGFTTITIAHVFFSMPYVILNVLPKLRSLDVNLYDAAVDLGCTPIKALIKVILPSIKTGIFAGMMLAFTMSIDDFVISFFTTGDYSNISIWIYSVVGKKNLTPAVYAYNTLITFGTLLVLIVYNYFVNRKTAKK